MAADSKFGTLGLDVGFVGRWSRLILGFLFVGPVAVQIANDLRTSGGDLSPYVPTVAYLAGIVAAYVAVYWVLGERLFARGFVWTNTAILVGPAAVVAWWNLTVGPVTGISCQHLSHWQWRSTLVFHSSFSGASSTEVARSSRSRS